jgi:hypothetical protein
MASLMLSPKSNSSACSKKIGRETGLVANEKTNDPQEKIESGAIKYDAGKAPIYRGFLSYFPRAIEAVSHVSHFGATKYAWRGWENVDDGINRYTDAMVRHLITEGKGETLDPDSGLLHAAHTAWNALARLELILKEQEELENWAMMSEEAKEIVDYINGCYYLQPNTDDKKEKSIMRE